MDSGVSLLDQEISAAANKHKMLLSGLSLDTVSHSHTINFTPSGPRVPTDGGDTVFTFYTKIIQALCCCNINKSRNSFIKFSLSSLLLHILREIFNSWRARNWIFSKMMDLWWDKINYQPTGDNLGKQFDILVLIIFKLLLYHRRGDGWAVYLGARQLSIRLDCCS